MGDLRPNVKTAKEKTRPFILSLTLTPVLHAAARQKEIVSKSETLCALGTL